MRRALAVAAKWLRPADIDQDALVRMFLFHHSGGNAAMYRDWFSLLPRDVAAQCIQLPGRHERRDIFFTEFEPLLSALVEMLVQELDDRPYALFGHSMGALLSYRLAVALERLGRPPALVAVSGWAPEGFDMPTLAHLEWISDDEIITAMCSLGSLPPEIRHDRDLLHQAVSAMRADCAVCASYRDDRAGINSPIVSYSGRDDPLVASAAMRSWEGRTNEYLGNREFPGGHFFLNGRGPAITADLVNLLRRYAHAS